LCGRSTDVVIGEAETHRLVGAVDVGAGKTTLLRVLAGIFESNEGSVVITGKVTPTFDVRPRIDWDSTGYEKHHPARTVYGAVQG
jgi:ABC-type polysaccharide/polyol phosphate transport system ATPase subunit